MPLWGVPALAVGPNYTPGDVDPEREKIAYNTITNAAKLARECLRRSKKTT